MILWITIIHLRILLKQTQKIFIDGSLSDDFHQNDKKDIKMVYDDILKDENLNQSNVLFEEFPERPIKRQIIRPNKKLELAANKIKKKILQPKTKKSQNPLTKKWLKGAGYLDTSNQQTIDCNNDAEITDLETVSNTNISDLKDNNSIDRTNLKKTSKAQIAA